MKRHREPRGGRSLPFAVSKERPAGSGPPFVLHQIEGKKADHGATAATTRRGYQLRAAPTPLTKQAIAALPCEILLSLVF
jgi:hypothetical protein